MFRWLQKEEKKLDVPLGARPDGTGLEPISREFGYDRGQPICRYYIDQFLQQNAGDIQGRVMEVADASYTKKFGGARVKQSDVLMTQAGEKQTTIVGNLVTGEGIPKSAFDCVIATQLYPFIYDVHAAIQHTHDALKPGGVLLATAAGISQISRYDMDRWGDYWRFTTASASRLFGDVFGAKNVVVESHGNVLVACGYLRGQAAEEFSKEQLAANDPDYQVLITVRAVKSL
jgi:hypothetical protein